MNSTITQFNNQKDNALKVLKKLALFTEQGAALGVKIHPDLMTKIKRSLEDIKDGKLRIALVGGFSEGKTSIAAAWLEKLDKETMKISHQESSNEVKIYEVGESLQIIDTPGLFGFKEKINISSQEIEKYKDITKRYISEAHIILYVMNSTNPIKESHHDDLQWLFRTLNLLPRTIFVLSRFDEVADVEDESDYLEKLNIKKNNITQRLSNTINLTATEKNDLSIVAVSANPFDAGINHWLNNINEFKTLSHIKLLQDATTDKIKNNGGVLALANEVKRSIISDVIQNQLPIAKKMFEKLNQDSESLITFQKDQEFEIIKLSQNISHAQVNIRGRIVRYFEDLKGQIQGLGIDTFNSFYSREIGENGSLIEQGVKEIFSGEVNSISSDLSRIKLKINSEREQLNDITTTLAKHGVDYLSNSGLITGANVLAVRNGTSALFKMVGIDVSTALNFKPWGAINFAKGVGSALAIAGVALEVWDSFQQIEREKKFKEDMQSLHSSLSEQQQELLHQIDNQNFIHNIFPDFLELKSQLDILKKDLEQLSNQKENFQQWCKEGEIIDVEFKNI